MRLLVLTGCDYAMLELAEITMETHADLASAMGAGFRRIMPFEYGTDTHPSWQKLRFVQQAFEDGYDRVLWLDADTVVTNNYCPKLSDCTAGTTGTTDGGECLTVSKDWGVPESGMESVYFSMGNFIWRNTQAGRRLLTAALNLQPKHGNSPLWEQSAIQQICMDGGPEKHGVLILPRRAFNSVPKHPLVPAVEPWEDGDFLCHMTAMPHEDRIPYALEAVRAGQIARLPAKLMDGHDTGMMMDVRHIAMLCEFVRMHRLNVLEIGAWHGAVTEQLAACNPESLEVCDTAPSERLLSISGIKAIHHAASVSVIPKWLARVGGDRLVVVDGDHTLENCAREAGALLAGRPEYIALHDIYSNRAGYSQCEGPAFLLECLLNNGYRMIAEDGKVRRGEKTHRGFVILGRTL